VVSVYSSVPFQVRNGGGGGVDSVQAPAVAASRPDPSLRCTAHSTTSPATANNALTELCLRLGPQILGSRVGQVGVGCPFQEETEQRPPWGDLSSHPTAQCLCQSRGTLVGYLVGVPVLFRPVRPVRVHRGIILLTQQRSNCLLLQWWLWWWWLNMSLLLLLQKRRL
jgi:hypothetical protein